MSKTTHEPSGITATPSSITVAELRDEIPRGLHIAINKLDRADGLPADGVILRDSVKKEIGKTLDAFQAGRKFSLDTVKRAVQMEAFQYELNRKLDG